MAENKTKPTDEEIKKLKDEDAMLLKRSVHTDRNLNENDEEYGDLIDRWGETDHWKLRVYKGKSTEYAHEVIIIKIESKVVTATKYFLMNEFNLEFDKKVLPFLSLTGPVSAGVKKEMELLVQSLIKCGLMGGVEVDTLLENTSDIEDDVAKTYRKNIVSFIESNSDLFAIRGEELESVTKENGDTCFDPKVHFGAYLESKYYKNKYCIKALAVCEKRFKEIASIDLTKNRVKDVVKYFATRGLICDGGTGTILKDLTLSRGNEQRCYVLDVEKIKELKESKNKKTEPDSKETVSATDANSNGGANE